MADDWDDHMPDEQDSLSDFVKFATTFTLRVYKKFKKYIETI